MSIRDPHISWGPKDYTAFAAAAAPLTGGGTHLDTTKFRALYTQLVALEKEIDTLESSTTQSFTALTNQNVTDSIRGLSDAHARSAQRAIGEASSASLAVKDLRNQVKTLKQAMYQSFEATLAADEQAHDGTTRASQTE